MSIKIVGNSFSASWYHQSDEAKPRFACLRYRSIEQITPAEGMLTMRFYGQISDRHFVTVRLDGNDTSPTRGGFFVTIRDYPSRALPERQMTRSELTHLRRVVVAQAQLDDPHLVFDNMRRWIDAALAGP